MGRNYITFLVVLIFLLVFSFGFAYAGIYLDGGPVSIVALVGFLVTLAAALIIGIEASEEYGMLGLSFYILTGVTAVILVWFLTRSGVLLNIW